jgi:hypothetical protein
MISLCGNIPTIKESEAMMITTWMRRVLALPSAVRGGMDRKISRRRAQRSPGSDTLRGVRLFVVVLLLVIVYAVLFARAVRRGGGPIPCPPPSEGLYAYCH